MNIIEQLSSSLGRRDEVPNQELAKRIVALVDELFPLTLRVGGLFYCIFANMHEPEWRCIWGRRS